MKKILGTAAAAAFVIASASAALADTQEDYRLGHEVTLTQQAQAQTGNVTRPAPRLINRADPDYDHSNPSSL